MIAVRQRPDPGSSRAPWWSHAASRRSASGLLVGMLAIGLLGCPAPAGDREARGAAPPADPQAAAQPIAEAGQGRPPEAVEAIARLRDGLGRALRQTLGEAGPAAAIEVCRSDAPRIARDAAAPGVSVGRTSHRLRNPRNAPEPWMEPLLDELRSIPQAPNAFRTVDLGPGRVGYVEPIYLQPLCATCHGEQVAPDLLEKIRAAYPSDEAVGFRTGELRGLFWAIVDRAEIHR